MNPQERFELVEKLKEIVSEMNDEVDCVIVEGSNDKQALLDLGFKKEIVYAEEHPLMEKFQTIVILTDFDSEGEKLWKNLNERLNGKTRINYVFREKFRELLTPSDRRDIESINNLLKN